MNKFLIAVLFLFLAGCDEGKKFKAINTICGASVEFKLMGNCIKDNLDSQIPNWHQDEDAAYVSAYIEWLNAAGTRVANGEMTESDARKGADDLLYRMASEVHQAKQAASAESMALFLSGLAILSYGSQTYQQQPISATTYTFKNGKPINCVTTGNGAFVNCY